MIPIPVGIAVCLIAVPGIAQSAFSFGQPITRVWVGVEAFSEPGFPYLERGGTSAR
jgi:hypothetical protein